ncbi:hypothetical protein [Phenylobacterium sp.]|uniref:hypothetical protein n=1 Tax=Phenylobacterium sp. TaxID=1871053 RepID=UPI0035AF055B
MFASLLAATVLLAQAAPADAAAAEAAKAAPTKAAAEEKDPMVCKNEAVIGSRMPKRVCALKSVWDARKQEARDNLEATQRAAQAPRGN